MCAPGRPLRVCRTRTTRSPPAPSMEPLGGLALRVRNFPPAGRSLRRGAIAAARALANPPGRTPPRTATPRAPTPAAAPARCPWGQRLSPAALPLSPCSGGAQGPRSTPGASSRQGPTVAGPGLHPRLPHRRAILVARRAQHARPRGPARWQPLRLQHTPVAAPVTSSAPPSLLHQAAGGAPLLYEPPKGSPIGGDVREKARRLHVSSSSSRRARQARAAARPQRLLQIRGRLGTASTVVAHQRFHEEGLAAHCRSSTASTTGDCMASRASTRAGRQRRPRAPAAAPHGLSPTLPPRADPGPAAGREERGQGPRFRRPQGSHGLPPQGGEVPGQLLHQPIHTLVGHALALVAAAGEQPRAVSAPHRAGPSPQWTAGCTGVPCPSRPRGPRPRAAACSPQ
jgi:hypothetical protein